MAVIKSSAKVQAAAGGGGGGGVASSARQCIRVSMRVLLRTHYEKWQAFIKELDQVHWVFRSVLTTLN